MHVREKMTETNLRGEISVKTRSPHDEPTQNEGDAEQGEQTAARGSLCGRWSRGHLWILNTPQGKQALEHQAFHPG